jgi:hypothetical protein
MTPVEQLALDVQTSVLDRLALQLAAVERAVVRVEAAASDVEEARGQTASVPSRESSRSIEPSRSRESSMGGGSLEATEVERAEVVRIGTSKPSVDDDGWTTVFDAREPARPSEGIGESPRVRAAGAPADRWSAPVQPRRHPAMPRVEPAPTHASEPIGAQAHASDPTPIGPREAASELRHSSLAGVVRTSSSVAPHEIASTPRREVASEPIGRQEPAPTPTTEPLRTRQADPDRWSRPMRPSTPSRSEPAPIGASASERPSRTMPAFAPAEPRESVAASTLAMSPREPNAPRESLQLPAPLHLADERPFDRLARPLEPKRERLPSERPRELGRSSSLAQPWPRAHELPEPTRSPAAEPTLDDEFDALARLEEQMADVLERVLLEMGVEP